MKHCVFDLTWVSKTRPGTEPFQLSIPRFQVLEGEALALVGPSGCGKSTALDLLACALRPDAPGKDSAFVFSPVEGRNVDLFKVWGPGGASVLAEDRMRHLGYVLQTGGLLPFLTAGANITLNCRVLNIVPQRIVAIKKLAERLHVLPLLGKYPAQLSVGERQRVAIAKALAHNPSVVLADEPTAALDPERAKTAMNIFLELAREQGTAVLMVSHSHRLAAELGFESVAINVEARADGVVSTLNRAAGQGGA